MDTATKIRLQVYRGVNNGVIYIKRGNGLWYSEYGVEADWFERHARQPGFGQMLFDGLVDDI